jgi:hypothetical protein
MSLERFPECCTNARGGTWDIGDTQLATGLDRGFQVLDMGEAGLASLNVLLELAAIPGGQFAVQVLGERSEDLFAVPVAHGCVSMLAFLRVLQRPRL